MSKKLILTAAVACLSFTAFTVAVSGGENTTKRSGRADKKLTIKVTPWGPTQADVDTAKQRVAQSDAVKRELNGSKFREVGFEYLYNSTESKVDASRPPTRFRVAYYNYSTDMTLFAEGDFTGNERITTQWVHTVPGISGDELRAAYRIAEQDNVFSALKGTNALEFYEPMPAVTVVDGERLVNIGIKNPQTGDNQIVGVSFKNGKLVRYANNAPPTSAATPEACGMPSAGQGPTGAGLAGQYTLTINAEGGGTLWEMLIIRPSASSGHIGTPGVDDDERSGLEIRNVKYKGKSVLKRGHVPILNVKYVNNCGPFRDWQYGEGFFQIPTTGVTFPAGPTGGFAIINAPGIATTSVETGTDLGNFRGVAAYTQDVGNGTEVVLVTEMEAGWYRYIMEWRFGTDGTIRPRYGFASVSDSCVCIQRTHHVYWRLDFDIVNPTNNIFLLERGRKYQRPVTTESAFFKSVPQNRSLLIHNASGDEAYQLVPGTNDGAVLDAVGNLFDPFGAGDFWLMRFKGTAAAPLEIDDPNGSVFPAANLSPWIDNESIVGQDVVVWYAAHQVRVDQASRPESPEVIQGSHVVGPTLRAVRW